MERREERIRMSAVRISSRKIESRNGRNRHLFAGELHSDTFGVVFSCDALILNLTDGERSCSVVLDEESTRKLAERFAEFQRAKSPRPTKGGPTEAHPDAPYCKPDQSCCDFCCGN
jgi:hypothetical protein